MNDAACPSIIAEFLGNCGVLARTAIRECYRSGSAEYIEGMLQYAESVLLSGDGRKIILRELLALDEPNRSLLLQTMQECSDAETARGVALFATLSKARSAVMELVKQCSRLDGCAWNQLHTLALVLGLGQTDDHEMMSRVACTRSPQGSMLAAVGAARALASADVEPNEV
jgi:hypothetical protein